MTPNFFTLSYLTDDSPNIMREEMMWYTGESACFHYHDFFEVSLVMAGSMSYETLENKLTLVEGNLLIIRPGEVHFKKSLSEDNLTHNWGFSTSLMHSMFEYLCEDSNLTWLLGTIQSPPPLIHLSSATLQHFHHRLSSISTAFHHYEPTGVIELKILLMEVLSRFFPAYAMQDKQTIPHWLEKLVIDMNQKEHFVEGMDAMLRLSHKSSAYLSRVFKKYYNTTPVKYITRLRLNYAAQMLINSNWDILKVALESGFESLSNFYHCFSSVFHMSPKKYRMSHVMIYTPPLPKK